jgi:hypothetical protein
VPGTIERFGSDADRIDLVAVHAGFGDDRCGEGWPSTCVNFRDTAAAEVYQNYTVTELVQLVRESAIKAEADLNVDLQWVQAKGFGTAAYTGGPSVGAAGYRHRASFSGAKRCLQCNVNKLGQKYGTVERENALASGYVKVSDWGRWCRHAESGTFILATFVGVYMLRSGVRGSLGTFEMWGRPAPPELCLRGVV